MESRKIKNRRWLQTWAKYDTGDHFIYEVEITEWAPDDIESVIDKAAGFCQDFFFKTAYKPIERGLDEFIPSPAALIWEQKNRKEIEK